VEIGAGTIIGPNASIMGRVLIGNDAIIGPNVVIGSDGYQVTRFDGNIVNMRHLGGVWLGDRVEIQAGTIIDRSLWPGFTEIGNDTKVGRAAHIAHCTTIGRRCRLKPFVSRTRSSPWGGNCRAWKQRKLKQPIKHSLRR
jgi:UDP-3-O-[3-hydroxymyristoyl] glucosamine N-acyltransferase